MKKLTLLSILFLVLGVNARAQSTDGADGRMFPISTARTATESEGLFSTKGMSPLTALLILDMKTREKNPGAITDKELIKKYCLINKGNKLYANSFIVGDGNFSIGMLDGFGVIPGSKSGKVYTGLVPIDQLAKVAASGIVTYLQIGTPVYPDMDSARISTNVNQAHKGLPPLNMPYTGKGVVVGDIDDGFDFTHPNFYDTSGANNYRIKRVWNQKDNSGTPPAGYSYGTEYASQVAMLSAGTDDPYADHGSHTAGIAAGAGGYPNSPYRGVAYESDIVMVAYNGGGASVADAIKYIQAYAASVNKPCVINMSFSHQDGPHDGTSLEDRYNDSLVSPGNLLIKSAGNNGTYPLYIGYKFVLTDTTRITFCAFGNAAVHPSNGSGSAYIWGNPNENFSVRAILYNTSTKTREDFTSYKVPANVNTVFIDTLVGTNNIPAYVLYSCGINPINNKPTITVSMYNALQPNGDRKIALEITGRDTEIKMWGDREGNPSFNNQGFTVNGLNGTTDHTVSDGGSCGKGVITVGAYTIKNNWIALNNNVQTAPAVAMIGDIAPFSSKGPTADDRMKPDITAPGNIIASSVNSFSSSYGPLSNRTAKAVTIGSQTWYFGMMEGTSMSTPMVTGIVALWLQKYPKLSQAQALSLMKGTAILDAYTGVIPATGSNVWGWGKINAFQGLITVLGIDDVQNTISAKVYPNPVTNEVNIAFENRSEAGMAVLYDMTGKIIFAKQLGTIHAGQVETINTNVFATGTYVLKISSNDKVSSYKIVKQ